MDRVFDYADKVLEGEIIAGPLVRASARRHIDDLEKGGERGLVWDYDAADRYFRFCRNVLRLSDGQFEGIPFELHESQAFITGSLMGWKRQDGTRRYRRAYVEEGKGNGKSPLAGGLGLYGLASDGEPGAEIYAIASTKQQAGILFADACKMRRKSPTLVERITPSGGEGREFNLAYLQNGSFFRPLSREARKSGSGPRPHFVFADEVHEMTDGTLLEILERGFKFRRQPLLLMITNSGSDRNSICWQERKRAVSAALQEPYHADGQPDDEQFSYICALDDDDDPLTDPTCWPKVNPLLGITVTEEYLASVARQAVMMPGKRNGILRLHFCVWTDSENAWIGREDWIALEDAELVLSDYEGRECYIGLDLSAVSDLTGKVYIFPDGKDDEGRPKFVAFVKGYLPEEGFQKLIASDGQHWQSFKDDGHLEIFEGKTIDHIQVAADLVDDVQRFDVKGIAYDTWLWKTFSEKLDEVGATDLPIFEHPQGWNRRKDCDLWMPESVDELELAIFEDRLRVEISPLLRYAVSSAAFRTSPAGLRRFDKDKAGKSKIDPLVALTMGIGLAKAGLERKDPDYQLFFVGAA